MGTGTAFGKTILIGDQFVLYEIPAIVAALPFVTEATVQQIEGMGSGWVLEDNRMEVPGYKEKKKAQQIESINRILEVMQIDIQKTPIKITKVLAKQGSSRWLNEKKERSFLKNVPRRDSGLKSSWAALNGSRRWEKWRLPSRMKSAIHWASSEIRPSC